MQGQNSGDIRQKNSAIAGSGQDDTKALNFYLIKKCEQGRSYNLTHNTLANTKRKMALLVGIRLRIACTSKSELVSISSMSVFYVIKAVQYSSNSTIFSHTALSSVPLHQNFNRTPRLLRWGFFPRQFT